MRYVADGRHALVRAAGAIGFYTRRAEVSARHRDLIEPLQGAVPGPAGSTPIEGRPAGLGCRRRGHRPDQGVETDGRIDRAFADQEADATVAFVHGGLRRLASRR
ncbi:MAG: hypothetical protein U0R65_07840 [Candidatus Nanopelagicales bacterium]